MENIKNTITDKQIERVAEVLGENLNKTDKIIRDMKNQIEDAPYPNNVINKPKLEKSEAIIEINQKTGEKKILKPASEKVISNNISISDIVDEREIKINEKELEEGTKTELDKLCLNDEEAKDFMELVMNYNKGKKNNIMDKLPQSFKNMVFKLSDSINKKDIEKTAKFILEQFINQVKVDKEFVDLQNAIKKELNLPGLVDMYEEHLKNTMEVDLIKKAKFLEEKGYIEKANILRKVSASYTSSYKFDKLIFALEHNEPASKRLDKYIKRYIKICNDFNYKYENSKFRINDINLVGTTLNRYLPEDISEDTIKKFVILFCKVSMNMDNNNVFEHAYMYYTIKNILSLDFIEPDNIFYKELLENIVKVIKLIENKCKEELKNKKEKR